MSKEIRNKDQKRKKITPNLKSLLLLNLSFKEMLMASIYKPATRDKKKRKWRAGREEKEREKQRGRRDRQAMCMGNSNFRSDLNCQCPVGGKNYLTTY